jgi:Tfp pilus assembly protein PilO
METNKQFIGYSLIAIALFLFWVLDVAEYQKVSVFRDAVQERQQLLTEKQNLINKVMDMTADAKNTIGDVRRFSAVVPSEKDLDELIFAIDRIANASGMRIEEVSIQESQDKTKEEFNKMSFEAKASGTYGSILVFVENVEKNIRLLDVKTISVSVNVLNPSTLEIEISADAYFLN